MSSNAQGNGSCTHKLAPHTDSFPDLTERIPAKEQQNKTAAAEVASTTSSATTSTTTVTIGDIKTSSKAAATTTTTEATLLPNVNKAVSPENLSKQQRAPEEQSTKPKSAKAMKSCRFFFSNRGCALGTSCKFSHDVELFESNSAPSSTTDAAASSTTGAVSSIISSSEKRVEGKKKIDNRPLCKFYAAGFCKWGNRCGFSHVGRPQKPQNTTKSIQNRDKPLSELTDQDLKALRKTEITQLKKRFPKRVDVDPNTFQFVFRPSDPDWPFDVKFINLELSFPDLYPKHVMSARIHDEACLPSTLARHICKKMNDWLVDKLETCQKADKVELVFRPFLRWLDKTAEQMFTDGLSMYKRELAAKAAGFTFVKHTDEKPPAVSVRDREERDEEASGAQLVAMERLSVEEAENGQQVEETHNQVEEKHSQVVQLPQQQAPGKLNPAKRGTELRLKNLHLLESVGTLHCTILRTGVRCGRCKTVHHITMHPEKPYLVVCDKCRSKMSLVFHANLMHASSCTVGYFDLDACQPFDLILQDCQLVAGCLNCDREILVHGLHADQEKQFWCTSCHKKMIISVEKGSYVTLNQGAAIKIGADAVLIAKKAKAKSDLRILAEGKPLPDKGACAHYKKSFRWFRFPCCGKLYPCDKCHDEKETDHEMELANRMVCGYCSKEQGFSLTRPCVSCDSSLTRAKSAHWEGGQGCRNKIAMAKGDKHKFSGSHKTVSKKAEEAQKRSGKKTTHVRHAV